MALLECSVERLGSLQRIGTQWREAISRPSAVPASVLGRRSIVLILLGGCPSVPRNRLAGALFRIALSYGFRASVGPFRTGVIFRIAEFAAAGAEIADARCLTFGAAGLTCWPWPSPFWKTKSLEEMSASEWENGFCRWLQVLPVKLEDESTGDIYFTARPLFEHSIATTRTGLPS